MPNCEHLTTAVKELGEPLARLGGIVVYSGTCECGEDVIVRLSITKVEEDTESEAFKVREK